MRPIVRGIDEPLFASMHRRYVDAPHAAPPWERLDAAGLDDALRARLCSVWSARAAAEYRSMVVFGELIARLPEAGLPLEVSCAASRLLQDEARHTELCARLAEALGASPDAARVDPRALHLADDKLPARLFVARWTVSMFCVGEAASVGLLTALRDAARDPCVRAVLATLLRDEVLHDRFGWALARTLVPALSDDEREWLGAELAFALAHYDRANGARLRPDGGALPDDEPLERHAVDMGLLPPVRFARAWYARLDAVILPQLAALGLPAYEAWALRGECDAADATPR